MCCLRMPRVIEVTCCSEYTSSHSPLLLSVRAGQETVRCLTCPAAHPASWLRVLGTRAWFAARCHLVRAHSLYAYNTHKASHFQAAQKLPHEVGTMSVSSSHIMDSALPSGTHRASLLDDDLRRFPCVWIMWILQALTDSSTDQFTAKCTIRRRGLVGGGSLGR